MVDQIVLRKYLYQQTLSRLTVFWQTPPPATREVTPALPHTHIHTHTRVACPYVTNRKRLKVSSSLCLPDVFF